MDIYEAIGKIEQFLTTYAQEHAADPAPWDPVEVTILPSGDEKDTIKLWFNFGPGVDEKHISRLLNQFEEAVSLDHPELKDYHLEVRGDAF